METGNRLTAEHVCMTTDTDSGVGIDCGSSKWVGQRNREEGKIGKTVNRIIRNK